MSTVTTSDRTTIAYSSSGEGAAVLLIHGMLSDNTVWTGLQPLLDEKFATYAVNRRGRAGSGEIGASGWREQFDDVVAVVDAIDAPVAVVGHSLGALVALGAAARTQNIVSLSLYDPAPTLPALADAAGHFETLVDDGQAEAAVAGFLKSVGTSTEVVAGLQATPFWPLMLDLAPTIAPEMRLLATADMSDLLDDISVPVLLLRGEHSPKPIREVCDALNDALPASRIVDVANQGHLGPALDPEAVFREVSAFIASLR